MFFFLFFFFILARQYSFNYFSSPSHTLSHIFFIDLVSSLTQPHIRPTDPISFDHLRPPDVNRHLWPPRSPCRSSLCHPPLAPWSHLTSSPSKNGRAPSPPLSRFHLLLSAPLKFHRRYLLPHDRSPFAVLRPYKRRDESTHLGSNLYSS
jgi:hypothetical protein